MDTWERQLCTKLKNTQIGSDLWKRQLIQSKPLVFFSPFSGPAVNVLTFTNLLRIAESDASLAFLSFSLVLTQKHIRTHTHTCSAVVVDEEKKAQLHVI